MKKYVTMLPMTSGGYRFVEKMNNKFEVLAQILSDDFKSGELIEWFMNNNKKSRTNEWISMYKKKESVFLYDISDCLGDDTYTSINAMLDENKRFEMSAQNFIEILLKWEELRVSRPDTILIVIHEDNHVSLETDPCIIKEYQDAGYAFDINKS